MLLRNRCEAGHPVLSVEMDLVEMAKSKLQEHLMSRYSSDSRRLLKPLLESWIRATAQERILSFDEDDSVKETVMVAIQNENLEDVVPSVH